METLAGHNNRELNEINRGKPLELDRYSHARESVTTDVVEGFFSNRGAMDTLMWEEIA